MSYFTTKDTGKRTMTFSLFLVIFLQPLFALAQRPDIRFSLISNEHGLSNNTIECIYQDHKGFIWFGTRDGLNKYDGYTITVFKTNVKDANSISDNYVKCIYEDRNRQLWIGTSNGLNRFNADKNSFIRFKHLPGESATISNNYINCIYEDNKGFLWIGTSGGLNLFNRQAGAFSLPVKSSLPGSDKVNIIYEDRKQNLWLGTDAGLGRIESKPSKINYYLNGSIAGITEDKSGKLWLGTEEKGIIVFDPASRQQQSFRHAEKDFSSIGTNQVRAVLCDKAGNVWVGGVNGGLNLFNPAKQNFYQYTDGSARPGGISQRTVSALFEDNQGNLWVGTHRGGVNLYTPKAEKFRLVQKGTNSGALSFNDVKAFCEDSQGNLWIGTDGGGLNLYNQTLNSYMHYRYSPFNNRSLGSDAVLDIIEDSRKNIWISTWGGGLNLLDRKTGTFTRFVNDANNSSSISSDYVQKAFEDSRGNLWVATYYGGLNLLNRKNMSFSRILNGKQNNTSLFGNNIVSLNEDRQGTLWIGTDDGGLNSYNPATGKFGHYFVDGEKLPDIRVIFTDTKGRLWLGQNGLYLFNPKKNKFFLYTHTAGLSSELIKGILEDSRGYLWISTTNGLIRFNPSSNSAVKYNTADGLQAQEFEANACIRTRNGEMYFGGINGYNVFRPETIRSNSFVPPVYITELYIFNRKVVPGMEDSPLTNDISNTQVVELSYRQSALSLSFAALNYTVSQNNQYAYKLEGLDKNWNFAGRERKASYTNLAPGEYTFYIKASNNDGLWNKNPAKLHIIISPPFWDTLWFKCLATLSLLAAAYFILNFKRKLELRALEEKKKEEIHQLQLQFFTNISHEFRTPLSLIIGPLEKLMMDDQRSHFSHYYKTISRNANRLMNLINELMNFRKVESGTLKLQVAPGNITAFIDEIADEFIDLAEERNISFSVRQQENLPEAWFDRQVLEKIAINLIYNSFKYTPDGGSLSVEILSSLKDFRPAFQNELIITNPFKAAQYLYLKVSDTGIGISKESISHLFERYYRINESHLGSGVGLAFVKSLTMLHKGEIFVYSERTAGTEIIIAIPYLKDDYNAAERWVREKQEGVVKLEAAISEQELKPDELNNPALEEPAKKVPRHILVVDDNPELRDFLLESLEGSYRISQASDGLEGFQKARESSPDLIISDVMMPGMDGIEFCRLIKQDIETCHIPFLMLTARDAIVSRIEGAESGADFYFSKPVSIQLLLLTLRNIFEQRQKLKEHYFKNHHIEARELVHSSIDKQFMDKFIRLIESQLSNPELDVEYVCGELGMSRTKLYQKIKNISGQSIGEFIRTIRLRVAMEIMTHEDISLSEVMFRVGIQTQSYFTKAFKKEFGKTPSQFLQETRKKAVAE